MEYQQLNVNRIREKVSDIKRSLAHLRGYADREAEEFIKNEEAVLAAWYSFIVVIEACINIANHLCARLLNRAPANYAETFLFLGQGSLISSELAEKLAQMARFRNVLVHGYALIDDRRMHRIIREDLDDVNEFIGEIKKIALGEKE